MGLGILKRIAAVVTAVVLSLLSLTAGFSLSAFAAEALSGSDVNFQVKISVNGQPLSGINSVRIEYPYIKITELGEKNTETNYDYCGITETATKGTYTFNGKVSEIINSTRGPQKPCQLYATTVDARGMTQRAYSDYDYYEGPDNQMVFVIDFNFKEPKRKDLKTPNWKTGAIYCFENCTTTIKSGNGEFYDYTQTCTTSKLSYEDQWEDNTVDYNTIHVFANGGKVETYGGASKNTKVVQLTLWENFAGKLIDTTKSKQIKWIVTEEKKCPKSFKQKSYTKYCSVTGGKLTAVFPGESYIWACRVDPDDNKKVVEGETCCLRVVVHDAPVNVSAHRTPTDTAHKITSLNMNIGEVQPVYLNVASKNSRKTGKLPLKSCTVEVTQGSEYVGVCGSNFGISGYYSSKITDMDDGCFYVMALSTKKNGKPSTARITVQSTYSSTKTQFTVNVSNGVVEVNSPADTITLKRAATSNQVTTLTAEDLDQYIITAAKKYFPDNDEVNALPLTDKVKIFATTDQNITRDKVYQTNGKGVTSVKFKLTKSKYVTASFKDGELTLRVKRNPKSENGNIVIAFNNDQYLIIPYTI